MAQIKVNVAYGATGTLATANIADLSVTTAKIAADAVTDAKVADDVIGTEHLTAGEVDATALGADSVTAAKIGDNVLNSEHYAAASIDNEHLADDAVDSDELAAGAVDTAHIADDQVTLAKMAGLARGKLIYGDSSGNPAALAVGSANEVLTHDGTDFDWAAAAGFDASSITGQTDYGNIPPATGDSIAFYDTSASALREITIANFGNTPAFSRFDNAALSIDSSTWTKLEFDSGHFDTHSAFDATNERFVVPANCGGTYWFSYSASIDNIYAGKYILANLYKNGSSWNNSFSIIRGNNNHSAQAPAFVRGSVIGELAATDYIELWIWHNHGSAYNTSAYATTLQGFRITGR